MYLYYLFILSFVGFVCNGAGPKMSSLFDGALNVPLIPWKSEANIVFHTVESLHIKLTYAVRSW